MTKITIKYKENILTKRVRAYLKATPGLWFLKVSDRFASGIPDFLICYQGKFIAIELKAYKKTPRKLQYFVMGELMRAGAIVAWFDDYDKFERWFESELGRVI